MLLTADKIFDGNQFLSDKTLEVEDGKIVAIHDGVLPQTQILTGTLTAGFIDYHVNGGGGKLFNFEPTIETLKAMVAAHAKFGTTAMVPTLITDTAEVMIQAADATAEAIANSLPGVLGVHYEGPHLSIPKKGVHEESLVRPIGDVERELFSRQDLGVKIITLAPENVSDEDIQFLVSTKNKVSLGHSNATFARAKEGVVLGADGFTHLFNAMSPFTSREPGVLGAALQSDAAWCGIIIDGHHMHYGSAQVAYAAKPKGKLLLVTDAMSTVGSDQQGFEFFGVEVIRDGDKLATPEGTLAGSALDMITAVKNAVVHCNIPLSEALNMASLYPAEYLGVADTMGSIEIGKNADLTLYTDDFNVTKTWILGELVHTN
ncbi:N-acetylglucosamine-6-phosphate deacetylase [Psychrosphaera sp. B3R10]|uniref:N-acetylglucosamine-6-phosphate deacetylase n=1 Tax=unclassified Psychrosphaera TaxID=2641570 RepID=UPI001C092D71|nr:MULTISPECIES: N-acetylglucosamine-6-phosphate deacetylase [unclassified Psychrosphaera]MBU2882657.1 N-acetylglucosamine-6-phosphate deacetylase [Psychrosphaera sp. I2R16]MBU2989324.1 N-acetylglucosamine-6-phosphate deacetylase [Psychrosphaera sp. B3R10]MDO6718158.1 N-acetylglucosamine-6-phosphate deacetylase [Psychrosphaera sp. 1_MG-2023]